MAKSLWNTGIDHFPAENWRNRLSEPLREDLVEMLASIERSSEFCPLSGAAPKQYGHCLYSEWQLPENAGHQSFQDLDPTGAVLCLSFATERAVRVGLDLVGVSQ